MATTTKASDSKSRSKASFKRAGLSVKSPPIIAVGRFRNSLGLTQAEFAKLLPISVRTLATLESGTSPTGSVSRRLIELDRLKTALSEVIQLAFLGRWLQSPNDAFEGLKPVEVIERGESDRLWEMIYYVRSGVPA